MINFNLLSEQTRSRKIILANQHLYEFIELIERMSAEDGYSTVNALMQDYYDFLDEECPKEAEMYKAIATYVAYQTT